MVKFSRHKTSVAERQPSVFFPIKMAATFLQLKVTRLNEFLKLRYLLTLQNLHLIYLKWPAEQIKI